MLGAYRITIFDNASKTSIEKDGYYDTRTRFVLYKNKIKNTYIYTPNLDIEVEAQVELPFFIIAAKNYDDKNYNVAKFMFQDNKVVIEDIVVGTFNAPYDISIIETDDVQETIECILTALLRNGFTIFIDGEVVCAPEGTNTSNIYSATLYALFRG